LLRLQILKDLLHWMTLSLFTVKELEVHLNLFIAKGKKKWPCFDIISKRLHILLYCIFLTICVCYGHIWCIIKCELIQKHFLRIQWMHLPNKQFSLNCREVVRSPMVEAQCLVQICFPVELKNGTMVCAPFFCSCWIHVII
jgi:hypothetical protein